MIWLVKAFLFCMLRLSGVIHTMQAWCIWINLCNAYFHVVTGALSCFSSKHWYSNWTTGLKRNAKPHYHLRDNMILPYLEDYMPSTCTSPFRTCLLNMNTRLCSSAPSNNHTDDFLTCLCAPKRKEEIPRPFSLMYLLHRPIDGYCCGHPSPCCAINWN